MMHDYLITEVCIMIMIFIVAYVCRITFSLGLLERFVRKILNSTINLMHEKYEEIILNKRLLQTLRRDYVLPVNACDEYIRTEKQ